MLNIKFQGFSEYVNKNSIKSAQLPIIWGLKETNFNAENSLPTLKGKTKQWSFKNQNSESNIL